ncbi:MAG TPA: hypothetical protein VF181_06955 [Balneolaceae bacterium]
MVLLVLPMVSCKDDSTGPEKMEDPATLTVQNQGTSNGNMVVIPEAKVMEGAWVVIHRSTDDGGPVIPDIIGKAPLSSGTNTDVAIQLEEAVSDGEKLWAMLHQDTGVEGEYEFTGSDSPDQPILVNDEIVMKSFTISQTNPKITAEDQVNKSNSGGTFAVNVDAAEEGWIVIHASNSAGDGPQLPGIIGKAPVEAGANGTVFVNLNEGETVAAGDVLWPMLHYDTGTDGEYEFDGQSGLDGPVFSVDGSIIMTSFTVQENQSTMTANDQTVVNNSITVDITADADGWVVVHRDAGDTPVLPGIMAKAPFEEGMSSVQISFGDSTVSDGEQLWPMLHYDTGTIGEYEFDGQSGLDQPMVVNGMIVMSEITVSGATPKVVANNQPADNEIAIAEADIMQNGFVVIHRSTDSGGPDVSGIIGKATIYTGQNGDVTITLNDGETVSAGETLWAMLHIDSNDNGAYDFDASNPDTEDPPVTDSGGNIVMVQFTVE